jgi:nucleotide-binding universal stress UspA family protein
MLDHYASSPAVVVGIDGSRSAVGAALWAVDEAVSRDIPLRLVCAIDPSDHPNADTEDAARVLATAEIAVRQAYTAVESTDEPVKIEIEILQTNPSRALIESSHRAALLCVGSIGLKHSSQGRIGSTAAALATAAHCPVAVVHGFDSHRAHQGWVVAELDEVSTLDGVLLCALEEARLRGLPLRVLTTWQSRYTDIHANNAVADGNRLARARLDRRLDQWRKRYPDLDVEAVAVHGSTLNYFAKEAGSIKLLVIGHERAHGIRELVGPPGYATLHQAGCSVLVCEPRNVL